MVVGSINQGLSKIENMSKGQRSRNDAVERLHPPY